MEWEEWGNPNEEKYNQYMMEYCPMQNVAKGGKYPACLLTGGLHDPRVQFWEPAKVRRHEHALPLVLERNCLTKSLIFFLKFTAMLRHEQDPSSGPVCLKMDMSAGHFSASDRYKYLKELAFDYAFMLDQLGLAK